MNSICFVTLFSSLAANEALQAIAREALKKTRGSAVESAFQQDSADDRKDVPGAADEAAKDSSALSLLQQAVREGGMLLPDGEVLLCRALLHNAARDNPFGYRICDVPILRKHGPSKAILAEAEKDYSENHLRETNTPRY